MPAAAVPAALIGGSRQAARRKSYEDHDEAERPGESHRCAPLARRQARERYINRLRI
jgi:hypothetical protein